MEAKYDAPREGDILDSQADISQARALLGYAPQVGFEEGRRRTFDWYRESHLQAAAKEAASFFRNPVSIYRRRHLNLEYWLCF